MNAKRWLVFALPVVCMACGSGSGTVVEVIRPPPPASTNEPPPSSTDPPGPGEESPGPGADPVGDASGGGCISCDRYLSCSIGQQSEDVHLTTGQDGECAISAPGLGGGILACGGGLEGESCTTTFEEGGLHTNCTTSQVGTWTQAGSDLTLCYSLDGKTLCADCVPTEAGPEPLPGTARGTDDGGFGATD